MKLKTLLESLQSSLFIDDTGKFIGYSSELHKDLLVRKFGKSYKFKNIDDIFIYVYENLGWIRLKDESITSLGLEYSKENVSKRAMENLINELEKSKSIDTIYVDLFKNRMIYKSYETRKFPFILKNIGLFKKCSTI